MSVDFDIEDSIDLLGKVASDLQENVAAEGNAISGTLKYVADYTGFSGDHSLQSGNFIALHAEVPGVDDAVITVKVTNEVELDEDGIAVLRIADKSSQTIKVVASKDGFKSVTKTYDLTGLICETEEPDETIG